MTSTAVRSSTALSIPPSQNTAPVHEFRCLYTHDVRKKSKKWQDGRVKYHTFNKRVMLYDDFQTFIGDTHWKENGELQPGDSVTLDIGVLIELEELMVTTQTDLAPLWEKDKNKQQQQEKTSVPRTTVNARATVGPVITARAGAEGTKQKHRSLNALLSKSNGSSMYGKALLAAQSPYEARKANQENEEWASEQHAKRRTTSEVQESGRKDTHDLPLWARTSDERQHLYKETPSKQTKAKSQGRAPAIILPRQVVDITSDADVPLSDITLPSSPKGAPKPRAAAPPKIKKIAPQLPKARSPPRAPPPPTSPPVSTKSKIRHVEILSDDGDDRSDMPAVMKHVQAEATPSAAKTKHLRIGKSQSRPMLMCQKKLAVSAPRGAAQKTAKKRRSNLFLALSDLEDEDEDASKPKGKTKPQVQCQEAGKSVSKGNIEATMVDSETSSTTAAFDTGQSSSPRLTAVRRQDAPSFLHTSRVEEILLNSEGMVEPREEMVVGKKASMRTEAARHNRNTNVEPQTVKQVTSVTPATRVLSSEDDVVITSVSKKATTKQEQQVGQSKKNSKKQKASPAKKAPAKSRKKSLRSIIDKTNEAAEEDNAIGSKAMEERAKALAAAPAREQGAWSIEALDLFDWRPPDWDERAKGMGLTT